MELLYDFLQITIPPLIVLYLAYLLVRSFLDKQLNEIVLNIKQKNQEKITPLRLQAYERVILLLERISIFSLVTRIAHQELSLQEFQIILVNEIRNEYSHNLSQQLYMSEEAWVQLVASVERTIAFINTNATQLKSDATSNDLAKLLLASCVEETPPLTDGAVSMIKNEVQQLFF